MITSAFLSTINLYKITMNFKSTLKTLLLFCVWSLVPFGVFAQSTQTTTVSAAKDYTKLSAVDMVNLFSKELLGNIESWDKLRRQDNRQFLETMYQWGLPWFNQRRIAAGVMGKNYYLKATPKQRTQFTEVLFRSLIRNYAQGIFLVKVTEIDIESDKASKNPKFHRVKQRVASNDADATIDYVMYRKNEQDYWRVVNVFADGINFKKTLNSSFERLAQRHDRNIDKVIQHWDNSASNSFKSNEDKSTNTKAN